VESTDLTTVGALVAAVIALAEVAKALARVAYTKFSKNGDAAVQRTMLETLTRQSETLQRQNELLQEATEEMLSELSEKQADLHKWHQPEVEPGVKIWWVRKSLEEAVKSLGKDIGELTKSAQKQVESCAISHKSLEALRTDIGQVKTEVHDMALKERYKQKTSSAHTPVKDK
jgi:prefoldin subunit 5